MGKWSEVTISWFIARSLLPPITGHPAASPSARLKCLKAFLLQLPSLFTCVSLSHLRLASLYFIIFFVILCSCLSDFLAGPLKIHPPIQRGDGTDQVMPPLHSVLKKKC